jgi:hypothetical protein
MAWLLFTIQRFESSPRRRHQDCSESCVGMGSREAGCGSGLRWRSPGKYVGEDTTPAERHSVTPVWEFPNYERLGKPAGASIPLHCVPAMWRRVGFRPAGWNVPAVSDPLRHSDEGLNGLFWSRAKTGRGTLSCGAWRVPAGPSASDAARNTDCRATFQAQYSATALGVDWQIVNRYGRFRLPAEIARYIARKP